MVANFEWKPIHFKQMTAFRCFGHNNCRQSGSHNRSLAPGTGIVANGRHDCPTCSMGKLIFHYLLNLHVDENEAGSASHIGSIALQPWSQKASLRLGLDRSSLRSNVTCQLRLGWLNATEPLNWNERFRSCHVLTPECPTLSGGSGESLAARRKPRRYDTRSPVGRTSRSHRKRGLGWTQFAV
jgi:hypothetical protein